MAKIRKKRQTYTLARRRAILAAAVREHLTADGVKKRFGVTPVTYYSWRKKYKVASPRGGSAARGAFVMRGPRRAATVAGRSRLGGLDIERQVRSEVQAKVHQIVQHVVRSEVGLYLESLFGNRRGRPRRT